MAEGFVYTHVHSNFSFLDGVASPEKLVKRAKEIGMPAMAITEHGNMFSAIPFYEACKKEGIKPILGIEGYVSKDRDNKVVTKVREKLAHIVLMAKNPVGYANLCRIVSDSYRHFYYKPRMSIEFISQHAEGIICTTACLNGVVSREFAIGSDGLDAAARMLERLKSIFKDDLYVEVMETGVVGQRAMNEALLGIAEHYNVKTVMTNDVHYVAKEDAEVQDVMLSLAQGTDIMDRKRGVVYGVFPDDISKPAVLNAEYWMKDREELQKFAPYIPKICFDNTLEICDKVEDINISFSSGKYMPILPKKFLPEEFANDSAYLRDLAFQGLVIKGIQNREEYVERLDHELGVIDKLNFSSYFLILGKIIDEVRKRKILIGPGRGSGAGSLVLYCLGITGIDPLKYGLMFERFLNPERIDLPDVDVDFEQLRRQEVVDVAINIFGADRVSKLATFNNMTTKLAIREAARGVEPVATRVDDLVKSLGEMTDLEPKETFDVTAQREEEHLRNAINIMRHTKTPRIGKTWYDFAMGLSGAPKAVSIHASGVVISKDPFDGILPTFRVNQESETALMADMHTVSKLGFVKFDLLGLTTLDIIKSTCEFIKKNHKQVIDPYDLPLDDKRTYQLLQSGNTCRVFQMEGGGFTDMLKGLKPTEFEHIIAMNALYRPGPLAYDPTIKMSMADKYIKTKNGDMLATPIHKLIDDVLEPTHYMMLFQEQIMEVSRRVAGYTMAEADNLRKIIGKKLVDKIEEEGNKFVEKAQTVGQSEVFARYVWNLIKPAGRYAWNRAHAAAYGMISYITAWLKANYPAEFMCANLIMVDAKQHRIIIDDCKRMGIVVARPDINHSAETFSVSEGKIYIGMSSVKGVGSAAVKGILTEREAHGLYKSFVDFINRNKMLPSNVIAQLAAGGSFAFDETINRREIIENISDIKSHVKIRNLAIKTMQQRLPTAPAHEASTYRRAIDVMSTSIQFDLPEDMKPLQWFKSYDEYELAKILELESDVIGLLDVDIVLDKYQSVATLVGAMTVSDALRLPSGSYVLVYGINGGVTVKYPKAGNTWSKFGVVTFADRTSTFDRITINTEDLDDKVSQGANLGCIKSSLNIKYSPAILQAVLKYSQKRGPQLILTGKALLPQFGVKIRGVDVQNLSMIERAVLKQLVGDFTKMEILTSDAADIIVRTIGKGRAHANMRVGASNEN
jgi:DNA polymerase-3 subunit alpha